MNIIHIQATNFKELGERIQQVLNDSPNMEKRLVDIKYVNEFCASIIFRKTSVEYSAHLSDAGISSANRDAGYGLCRMCGAALRPSDMSLENKDETICHRCAMEYWRKW